MTTSTATRFTDPQCCLLNALFDLSASGRSVVGERFTRLADKANVIGREHLYPLADAALIRVTLTPNGFSITNELRELSDDVLSQCRLHLTTAGCAWVEDNPRNSLLRRVNASPLGRVTLRRAMQHVDGEQAKRELVRQVLDAGYVSLHDAVDRMEVRLGRRGFPFNDPDAFILLPTPKIRRVLGS